MDAKSITIVSILLAALMLYFNITYLQSYSILFTTLNIVIVMIGLGIPVAYHYETYSRLKKIEQLFPIFLRDVTANIKNGMTLPQAIRSVKYIECICSKNQKQGYWTHCEYNNRSP